MNPRIRAWVLILIIAVVCGGVLGGLIIYRARHISTAQLLKRMPTIDSMVVYIDFEKLRQGGLLQLLDGSKMGEDPEYQEFARKTDFHWAQDLDRGMLAVSPSGNYFLVQGRFDWKSLRAYADSQGGNCYNTLCRMKGSTEDRHISFLPLQNNLMALAVSHDEGAATRLSNALPGPDPEVPEGPVWITIPSSMLRSDSLPEGTVSLARSVADADRVTLSFLPEGQRLAAKLTVICRSSEDARKVADDLMKKTEILRSMIAHAHANPGPLDMAGVVAAGSFQTNGRRVFGYWPMDPKFVERLLGGS